MSVWLKKQSFSSLTAKKKIVTYPGPTSNFLELEPAFIAFKKIFFFNKRQKQLNLVFYKAFSKIIISLIRAIINLNHKFTIFFLFT